MDLMGKARRSQEMIDTGMGLVNGIILYLSLIHI